MMGRDRWSGGMVLPIAGDASFTRGTWRGYRPGRLGVPGTLVFALEAMQHIAGVF